LPAAARPTWLELVAELKRLNANPRVYGSYGWQLLSGFAHVRAGSDIDLWLSVSDWAQADAAAARLQAVSGELPRVDGELMFDDGTAVAWREWLTWRGGKVKSLLVKSIAGSSLERSWGRQGAVALAEAA
jgi:phosphoribosyl-dephospho-CoA transferase